MRAFFIALAIAAQGLLGVCPVAGQLEGAYRFAICKRSCPSTDTEDALASGVFVLFPDSMFAASIPSDDLTRLRAESRSLLLMNPEFNACFRARQFVQRVDGFEFFAGIVEEGLTRWEVRDGEVYVRIYQSPDGHFTLIGTAENGRITGRGDQAHVPDPKPPDRAFLAERIGAADPSGD